MFGGGRPARYRMLLSLCLVIATYLCVTAPALFAESGAGGPSLAQSVAGVSAQTVSYLRAHHFKVFLDVGHGGYDPGGTGPDGLPESFVNLQVAKKTERILRSEGIVVELDRSANRFVSLSRRVTLANASGADLFVGLYCNASSDPAVHGTTTYYYHANSYKLARYLEDTVARRLGLSNDGVMRDSLYVIRYTTTHMPDVLIEYAYISNRHEEHLLAEPAFRTRIAASIAKAISGYLAGEASGRRTNQVAKVTSVRATNNGTVQIHSVGRPTVGSYTFRHGRSTYYVVALRDAVLGDSQRPLSVGPPFSGHVSVVQFTTKPDVVHVAVREDYPNSYSIAVDSSPDGHYITTIYPLAN